MIRRSFLILLLVSAACSSTDNPKQEPPSRDSMSVFKSGSYSSDSGTDPVGVIPEAKIHDVGMSIEYPIKAGSYPLIVFSHGGVASRNAYEALVSYWTSYGYVCIRARHANAADAVRDIRSVLDSLDELERKYPELKGKIDRTRIGIGGHQDGAVAAMLASNDARARAVLALSPRLDPQLGLTAEALRDIRIPMMFMTGANPRTNEVPQGRREAFASAAAGEKYFVMIQGAHETSFGGRFDEAQIERETTRQVYSPSDPYQQQPQMAPQGGRSMTFERERRIIADIRIISLAFWDAYLKELPSAREYMASAHMNEGLVKTEKK